MTKYFKSLQLLRTFAFLSIFFYHVTVLDEAFSRWSITVFLMLSGFLNALHGYKKSPGCDIRSLFKYAVRKIKGIYPLHILMLAVAFVLYVYSERNVIFANLQNSLIMGILKILTNVFLISDWGPKHGWWYNIFSEYNIVTWYLSLSLLLFILTPLCFRIMHRLYDSDKARLFWIRPLLVSLIIYTVTIIVNLLYVKIFGRSGSFLYTYESPISRMGDYLIALQMGYVAEKIYDKYDDYGGICTKFYNTMFLVSLILTIALLILGITVISGDNKWIVSSGFYFSISTALLIFSLAIMEDLLKTNILSMGIVDNIIRILLHLGNLSQFAFLIHVPVINLVHGVYIKFGDVNKAIWSIIAFVITIVTSEIIYIHKKYVADLK